MFHIYHFENTQHSDFQITFSPDQPAPPKKKLRFKNTVFQFCFEKELLKMISKGEEKDMFLEQKDEKNKEQLAGVSVPFCASPVPFSFPTRNGSFQVWPHQRGNAVFQASKILKGETQECSFEHNFLFVSSASFRIVLARAILAPERFFGAWKQFQLFCNLLSMPKKAEKRRKESILKKMMAEVTETDFAAKFWILHHNL